MKKILLVVALLGSGYAFSQSMPPTFPVEMYYGCTYEKGKDIEDMMEVGEEWREWQEENDPVGRENYNAWIFTADFAGASLHGTSMWFGVANNWENFTKSHFNWVRNGAEMSKKFEKVMGPSNCMGHLMGVMFPTKQAEGWEPVDVRPVFTSLCTAKENTSLMDFNSAYSKMNAFLDAGGMSNKVAMFKIFPVAGQTTDYDFATMMVLRDDDALGELATLMSTGGAAMQSSLFEPLQECSQNSMMLSSPLPGNTSSN